jgi:CheY-like chemotaxis protein
MHPQSRPVPFSDQTHAPVRATLLIVDDESAILHMLRDILEDEGYAVLMAQDGQEGFDLALEHYPNLILTDLMMQ